MEVLCTVFDLKLPADKKADAIVEIWKCPYERGVVWTVAQSHFYDAAIRFMKKVAVWNLTRLCKPIFSPLWRPAEPIRTNSSEAIKVPDSPRHFTPVLVRCDVPRPRTVEEKSNFPEWVPDSKLRLPSLKDDFELRGICKGEKAPPLRRTITVSEE